MQRYIVDSRKLGYAEYWRLSSSFGGFAIAALCKLFGKRLDFKSVIQRLDHLIPIDAVKVQELALQPLQENIQALNAAGMELKFYYTIPPAGQTDGCAAVLLSPDCKVLAQVLHVYSTRPGISRSETVLGCTSWKVDGNILASTNRKQKFNVSPALETARFLNVSPGELYERHRARIENTPVQTLDAAKLDRFVLDLAHREIDFNVARGVYVPAPDNT